MSRDKTKMLRAGETCFDLLILAISIALLIVAYRISGFAISAPGTFPLISTTVMVGAMLMVLKENRKKPRDYDDVFTKELGQAIREVFTPTFTFYTLICIVYVLLIDVVHFLPSSFVFLVLSMIYLKGSSPLKAGLISTVTLAGIYLVFLYFFKVILP